MENIFDLNKTPLKIEKPIRLIELFAGIGAQAKALERLGANFEHYKVCEFDKYAIASYNAVHGTNFETSDIRKITAQDLGITDTETYCYIMTYSFPCQDLSLAGKGKGMAKGENTRSGLLWKVERLLDECTELPQILLMENVTQVHGTKNKEHFEKWIKFLESKGYSNYWKDLNAKNFGIPQNRNRTFMVSVLGEYTYEFPQEFPLELRLKDMLETEVDEKFYLSNEQMKKIVNWKAQQKPFERVLGRESITQTLTARGAGENHSGMVIFSPENENTTNMQSKVIKVCKINSSQDGVVASTNGIAPTHTAGHGNTPKIIDPFIVASRGRNPENPSDRTAGIPTAQRLEPNFSGCANTLTTVQKDNYVAEPRISVVGNYSPSGHDASRIVDMNGLAPTVKENHGTVTAIVDPIVWDGFNQRIRAEKGTVGCLTTNCGGDLKRNGQGIIESQSILRIRKLTPKECWRLMGFDDADFEKASAVNSNTQLYKQAGNSIVVDVLYYIFKNMGSVF